MSAFAKIERELAGTTMLDMLDDLQGLEYSDVSGWIKIENDLAGRLRFVTNLCESAIKDPAAGIHQ